MSENTFAENVTKARSAVGEEVMDFLEEYLWTKDKDWADNFPHLEKRKNLAYIALDNSIRLESLEPLQKFCAGITDEYVKRSFATQIKEVVLDAAKSRALGSKMMRELDTIFHSAGSLECLGTFSESCSKLLHEDLETFELLTAKMPNFAKLVAGAPVWNSDFFKEDAWLFVELYPEHAVKIAENQLASAVFDAHHFYRSYEDEKAVRLLYRNYPKLYENATREIKSQAKKGILSPINSDRALKLAETSLARSMEKYKETRNPILRDYNKIMTGYIDKYKERRAVMGLAKALIFAMDANNQKLR